MVRGNKLKMQHLHLDFQSTGNSVQATVAIPTFEPGGAVKPKKA